MISTITVNIEKWDPQRRRTAHPSCQAAKHFKKKGTRPSNQGREDVGEETVGQNHSLLPAFNNNRKELDAKKKNRVTVLVGGTKNNLQRNAKRKIVRHGLLLSWNPKLSKSKVKKISVQETGHRQ